MMRVSVLTCRTLSLALLGSVVPSFVAAAELAPGVRGVATRAPDNMTIDGNLEEFRAAFSTPVEYHHADVKNRAAQFFYMWDDEAFYAGLRTLDEKQANHADDGSLWGGDAVEWYFDTRRGANFRDTNWRSEGAVHCYWTGYKGTDIEGRFCLRPGYLEAIPKIGVEVAARKTKTGAEVEFKLPWANFKGFAPKENDVLALDAELCYSDGGPRVFRTFVFGSPLSVQQPASLGRVQLVDQLQPEHWKACGPVMMPFRIDTPWQQKTKANSYAVISLPPNHAGLVHDIVFRITDLSGETVAEFPAKREWIVKDGAFLRATANWPSDVAVPGAHHVTAIVKGKGGKELTRIAPRLVSVNWVTGY